MHDFGSICLYTLMHTLGSPHIEVIHLAFQTFLFTHFLSFLYTNLGNNDWKLQFPFVLYFIFIFIVFLFFFFYIYIEMYIFLL